MTDSQVLESKTDRMEEIDPKETPGTAEGTTDGSMQRGESLGRDLETVLMTDSPVPGSKIDRLMERDPEALLMRDYQVLGSKEDKLMEEVDAKRTSRIIGGGETDGSMHCCNGVHAVVAEAARKMHSNTCSLSSDIFLKDIQDASPGTSCCRVCDNAHESGSMRSGGPAEMHAASCVSTFQCIPSEVLEFICVHLTTVDLCSLCQVNRYCEEVCSRDEFWRLRASNISKTYEDLSWKQNVFYAEHKRVCVRPLGEVYLKGALTIIDPSKIFFTTPEGAGRMEKLQQQLQDLQQEGHWEFLVTYRSQAAYFISSKSWDQDAAFEISRNGKSLGVDELPSRFIAVLTKKMVDLLLEENGEGLKPEDGVSVEGVEGQLILSGDGDFVISGSGTASPVLKLSRWIEDDCVHKADILCAAGGRWTFCDDTSDEEEDEFPYDDELMTFLEQFEMDGQWNI